MTNLPNAELVGILQAYSINNQDIGRNWKNYGAIIAVNKRTMLYMGGGIVIAAGSDLIARSNDYGNKWTNIFPVGVPTATAFVSSTYVGNGIGLIGDGIGHIFRSIDYGVNWDLAGGSRTLANAPNIASLAYIGNNIAIAGTGPAAVTGNSIWRSIDSGLNFTAQVYGPVANGIGTITYLENGIAIAGDDGGHIHRSTNQGLTWISIGSITTDIILCSVYLGRGIVLVGTDKGKIYRSLDYGITFSIIAAAIFTNGAYSLTYIGNGNVIATGMDGPIGRIAICTNFTLGTIFSTIATVGAAGILYSSAYADNGIAFAGGASIWRSDVSYKTNEATSVVDPSIISTTASITVGQPINTVLADVTGGNIVITLDSVANLQKGHEFVIKKTDATSNTVTITPAAGTIDGIANKILSIPNQYVIIRTDGTNWFIISDFVVASSINTIGHLTPAITRYEMPGWCCDVLGSAPNLAAGVIYYVPFFVVETTTYIDISIENASSIQTGSVACRIYNWNGGVPGSQVLNVGTFSWAGEFNATKTIVINLTLNRGFYFVALRLASGTIGLFEVNKSGTVPVGGMKASASPTPSPANIVTTTVTAAFADPAPAPTGMTGTTFMFLMKTHV